MVWKGNNGNPYGEQGKCTVHEPVAFICEVNTADFSLDKAIW